MSSHHEEAILGSEFPQLCGLRATLEARSILRAAQCSAFCPKYTGLGFALSPAGPSERPSTHRITIRPSLLAKSASMLSSPQAPIFSKSTSSDGSFLGCRCSGTTSGTRRRWARFQKLCRT